MAEADVTGGTNGATGGRTARPPAVAGPAQGGRGAAEQLLAAAAKLFAERGYADVSTRTLTRAAGVNLSAITYHFGGKEGLFRAVIARMLRETEPLRRALIDDLRAGIAGAGADRADLARVARIFVRRMLAAQVLTELPGGRMQIMLREINKPSFAFEEVMASHVNPIHDAVCALVAAARRGDPGDEAVRLLAHAAIGQCVIFGIGRRVIQTRLGWDEVTPERFERIVDVVSGSVLATLDLQVAVEPSPPGG